MPNYDYKCSKCDFSIVDVQLPIAERDEPVGEACPLHELTGSDCSGVLERVIASPGIGYTYGGIKTPSGFKDVLRNIKKNHRGSTINV
jgi:predicted nucleic acid-binding Zn ribbon protein